MKTPGFFLLLVVVSIAGRGATADASSAVVPLLPRTPASSSAASAPPMDTPAGRSAPGAPRGPKSTPVPAPTDHYAARPMVPRPWLSTRS